MPNGAEDHDKMLVGFYLGKGSSLNELGNQSAALLANRKAVTIAEALVQRNPASMQARREHFLTYEEIILPLAGRDALNVGDSAQAQVYARKALAIAQMLVGIDSKNAQSHYDLALAYTSMGDSFRLTNRDTASGWYRKSISLTKELSPLYGAGARHWIAIRNEALAEVLQREDQVSEQLRLLLEANLIRRELAGTSPHGRLHLMRSYCKLSDAELAMRDMAKARQYANAALPFLDGFQITSTSVLVVRDVGFCYETYPGSMEKEQVRAAIGNLPTVFREVILLREFEEFSYHEMVGLLDCPVEMVVSRLAKARSKLRILLSSTLTS
jgi:tetratricopeptide (TPR) repeat protein